MSNNKVFLTEAGLAELETHYARPKAERLTELVDLARALMANPTSRERLQSEMLALGPYAGMDDEIRWIAQNLSRWYLIEPISVDTCTHLLKSGYNPNDPEHADVFEPRRKDLGFSFKPPMAGAKQWELGEGPFSWTDDIVKKFPNEPMVLLHQASVKRAQDILVEEAETDKESALDQAALQETTERFPDCPVLPGALTDLARAIYPSLPLEFKMWGLITRWGLYRSGLDRLTVEPHLQPRFFAVLVALPNRGKTACINESRTSMKLITDMVADQCTKETKPHGADVECLASADSGPFLVEYLYDKTHKVKEDVAASLTFDDRAKVIMDSDELSDVFEKAKSSMGRVSTLFTELLKLHSGNRTGNGTRRTGDMPVDKAHLAILSGTTVKKYPMLWTGTGGGGDGLVSRFIAITTNAPQVPPVPLQTDTVAAMQAYERLVMLAQLSGQAITLKAKYDFISKGTHGSGLALDAKNHILFAYMRDPNPVVVISNADDGKPLATFPTGGGLDTVAFNPATMEAISAETAGTMTFIKENSPTSFEIR